MRFGYCTCREWADLIQTRKAPEAFGQLLGDYNMGSELVPAVPAKTHHEEDGKSH